MTPKIRPHLRVSKAGEKEMVMKESLRGRQPRDDHSDSNEKTPPPFLPDDIGPTTRSVTGARLNHGFGIGCRDRLRVRGSPRLFNNAVRCRLLGRLRGGCIRRLPSYRLTHVWQVTHRGGAVLGERFFELALLNVPRVALTSPGAFISVGRVDGPGGNFIRHHEGQQAG